MDPEIPLVLSVSYKGIAYLKQNGRFYVRMWGWWGHDYPYHRWVEVADSVVPSCVKAQFKTQPD